MKKILTVIILIAVTLIIFAAYFGIYGVEIPAEYAVVSNGFKYTLTITLLAATVAHIAAILPGILLGKAGIKKVNAISGVLGSLFVAAPFLISALIISALGNEFYMIVAAVAIPLFAMSVLSVAENTARAKERRFYEHKLALSRGKYFKNYTLPFAVKPYFAKGAEIFRSAFYTVTMLEVLNIMGVTNLGGLIRHENTSISGTALAVIGIFVLLIQILCMLTKQKEEVK